VALTCINRRGRRHPADTADWRFCELEEDHDAYHKAFERLLRDLKAESAEASE